MTASIAIYSTSCRKTAASPIWSSPRPSGCRPPKRSGATGASEEIGAIKRYETRLDADTLGFGVTAFVQVTMERGHIRDLSTFQKLVSELAQIQECFSVTGDIDYVLKVVAADLKGLSTFLLDTLMRIPGVSGVHSSVCLDEIKCTSAMPL